jgi:hypothetical protein
VVVLDQLEDLAAARPDAAARLLALIVSATQQAPDLRFLVTLRWESLEHLVTPEVAAVFGDGTVFDRRTGEQIGETAQLGDRVRWKPGQERVPMVLLDW